VSGTWKNVKATWLGEMAFQGQNESGGKVQIGTFQGQPGIGPMEMLLLGVAGCTGMDIVSILEKGRQKLTGLKVNVRGLRAQDYPMVYTEIEIEYLLWGEDLDPQRVERAIALSEEKYCSASIMLRATAAVRSSYQIFDSHSQG
jgi:putative redox protein